MKFDKLRLTGFKSFVEPTDIIIEKGLTGVVGPNGCGKSNLVEALRWVMGEASYKSVRGTSMDDVIFAGSGRRAARDTAEVALILDNSDRTAPAELNTADELEVTRTITRAIGSDYRVNGKTVRARDVQLLFADAATGSRSPSMVRQGQVAELIAAKPTDRRNILEEAAGIAGLRARKHEASLKLNAAEQNLSRVDDVAGEVERQMETLKRQARQANRYKTISSDIRTLEATVHHLRWVEARASLTEAEATLKTARAALDEAGETQTRTATDEAAATYKMPALREAEAEALAARQQVAAEIATLDEADRQTDARLKTLNATCAGLSGDLERQRGAEADAGRAMARLAGEEESLKRANEGCDAKIEALEAHALRLAAIAEEAEAAASKAVEETALVLAARKSAETAFREAETEANAAKAHLERVKRDLAAALESDAIRAADGARAALEDAEDKEAAAAASLVSAEAALPPLRAAEADARQKLESLTADISGREAETKALSRLAATVDAGSDAVLEAAKVETGFETAFAVALGDDLSAPVSADAPLRWTENPGEDPPLPGGIPLSEKVVAPAALTRRLKQIAVVEEGQGPELMQKLAAGQLLVSRGGAVWRWDGFCRSAGAPSAAAERLAQKNRHAALSVELETLLPQRASAEDAATAARATVREAQSAESEARQRVSTARAQLGAARKAAATAEAAAREAETAKTRLTAALETADARAQETADALSARQAQSTSLSDGAAEVAHRDGARQKAASTREQAAEAGNAMEAERRAIIGRMKRLERVEAELRDWRNRAASSETHRAELTERLKTATAERDALANAPSETAVERRRLNAALEKADAERQATTDARLAGERAEQAAKQAARNGLDGLSTAREAAGRADERLDAATERLQTVEHDLREALDTEPVNASRLAGLDPDAPLPDRGGLETKLERLKAERERLGGVNLCAEDELAEITERQGAMIAERDDLLAAIDKLRQGIRELNKEARTRLLDSFDHVNAQFQRLFTHLFGGGEASLQLTEAEDPLDAGLDIIARPPGKKPQSLSLLSGGEQTLTATALIFAVFLTNPAPICVLDEIDAPLDDANVARFCALLDEMTNATETRFMIITHNPITMAHMHRLYGVTMVEKGVSQLVSVNLEAAEALRESA
ncbi:MAG: AAA family ATPase [Pseudomonadota bacterium]